MTQPVTSKRSRPWVRSLWWAVAVRIALVAISFGSNDVAYWSDLADSVDRQGLIQTYENMAAANHPPVAMLMMYGLYLAAEHLGLPFRWLLKMPAIAADGLVAAVLMRIDAARGAPQARSASAYLWAPAVILLSAYHGNTDPVYGALILVALWQVRHRPLLAGFAFGVAVNVKLVAALPGVALLVAATTLRNRIRFVLGALPCLLPFVLLGSVGGWNALATSILGYVPAPGNWGLPFIASLFHGAFEMPGFATSYSPIGRILVIASAAITPLVLHRGGASAPTIVISTVASYFVLTPGIGLQHFALILAVGAAAGRSIGQSISLPIGLLALFAYGSSLFSVWPLASGFVAPWPSWVALPGLLVWAWLLALWLRPQMIEQRLDPGWINWAQRAA